MIRTTPPVTPARAGSSVLRDKSALSSSREKANPSRRVGVLPLTKHALTIGDDGRAIVWLDIDNTLYRKSTRIAEMMTERIRAYFREMGLSAEEAHRLHLCYYKEYGLAIRGLVMHHEIDALDYDAKCDATLPLDDILRPDQAIKQMLGDLDRTKVRVWALTNAYKTHAVRVLRLLELESYVEGVIYCDYSKRNFACKPEAEFYNDAMAIVGMTDPSRCYFVDDSKLNITAARRLGWRSCVLFEEKDGEMSTETDASEVHFNAAVLHPNGHSSPFDEQQIQAEFRKLSAPLRRQLLRIILDACLPGDIPTMKQMLEKHLSSTRDVISGLPDAVHKRIFECLSIPTLLRCRRVSKRWSRITACSELWRSHALALTEGDPTPLVAPDSLAGWEALVKGLYFRDRNWANGICQSITLMRGHTGFVTAMKLKGRNTLVTGSYDETIRVWNLTSGQCTKVLQAKAIACLDFLADEGVLAAGLYDSGRVMLWDMRTWTLLQTLSGHNRGIRNVALSCDYLVSVGQDKAIVVWDWRNGTKIVRFGQQSNVSLGVSIVDNDKIVAVTVDGIIRTFNLAGSKKEMIGQFDVAKLAPGLSARLSGLKDGTNMMQWFAAHRNTITMGSQNTVIHLQWQEHVVQQRRAPRSRRASTESNVSTTSVSRRSSLALSNAAGTPRKSAAAAGTNNRSATPSRSASMRNIASPRTPATNVRTPSGLPQSKSVGAVASFARPSPRVSSRLSMTSGASRPVSPMSPPKIGSGNAATRIAPNLSVAPLVLSIIDTADSAVGCVDAAKRRIVCSSRFSSRAGADRKLYTTTFEEHKDGSTQGAATTTGVVPVGGAWQAQADGLALPARNPMSLVLDPDHCVVGTSEGLVYSMGFVGAQYNAGWVDTDDKHEDASADPELEQNHQENGSTRDEGTVISELTDLRRIWPDLFKS